jgi:tRNA uridine 5-carboxymethylaminomethyl modification enzyme
LEPGLAAVDAGSRRQVEIDALYATYVARQSKDAESLKRDEGQPIPSDLDYADISGLSNELRGKLQTVQPRTLGQAGRIEGMTPAALALILTTIRRRELKSA